MSMLIEYCIWLRCGYFNLNNLRRYRDWENYLQ